MAIRSTAPVSSPAYRVIDRRNGGGWSWQSNNLFKAATQSDQRRTIDALDRDQTRNVTAYGRRVLMSAARWLFSNTPAIHGAILEQAMLSSENMQPLYAGANKAWGDAAEMWLLDWHERCLLSGWPGNWQTWLFNLIVCALRDGDSATLLVRKADGQPIIQHLGAHRITSGGSGDKVMDSGAFSGTVLLDGVLLSDKGYPVGYRIAETSTGDAEIVDVSSSAGFLTFLPRWPEQVRGITALAPAVFDILDFTDSREFELLAQKACAANALIEDNTTGEMDATAAVLDLAGTQNADGTAATISAQKIEGGLYRYFRANSGQGLKAFHYDRPGSNVMAYQDAIIRDAFVGLEWNYLFSVDPSKVGGASMRIVVEKLNRVVKNRRAALAQAARRVDRFAIACAMDSGELPFDRDWFRWEYQPAREITADRKYDSDVDVQEVNARLTTLKEACGRRSQYWEDVQDQWLLEKKRLQDRAKEMGIEIGPEQPAATIPNRTRREPVNEDEDAETEGEDREEQAVSTPLVRTSRHVKGPDGRIMGTISSGPLSGRKRAVTRLSKHIYGPDGTIAQTITTEIPGELSEEEATKWQSEHLS